MSLLNLCVSVPESTHFHVWPVEERYQHYFTHGTAFKQYTLLLRAHGYHVNMVNSKLPTQLTYNIHVLVIHGSVSRSIVAYLESVQASLEANP